MGSHKYLLSLRSIYFLNITFTFIDSRNSPYFEKKSSWLRSGIILEKKQNKLILSSSKQYIHSQKKVGFIIPFPNGRSSTKRKNKCALKILFNCVFSWKASVFLLSYWNRREFIWMTQIGVKVVWEAALAWKFKQATSYSGWMPSMAARPWILTQPVLKESGYLSIMFPLEYRPYFSPWLYNTLVV